MMDWDNITQTGARAPGVERLDRSDGGVVGGCSSPRLRARVKLHLRRHEGRRQTTVGVLSIPYLGKAPTDSRPWSRIGENPPYGILGRAMETSASCEARLAPSLYPTAALALSPEARAGCGNTA